MEVKFAVSVAGLSSAALDATGTTALVAIVSAGRWISALWLSISGPTMGSVARAAILGVGRVSGVSSSGPRRSDKVRQYAGFSNHRGVEVWPSNEEREGDVL